MTYEEFVADPLREIERMGEIIAANEAIDPGFYADPAVTAQIDGELSKRSLTVEQRDRARWLAFMGLKDQEQRYLAGVPAIPAPRPRSTTSNTRILTRSVGSTWSSYSDDTWSVRS